MPQGTLGHRRCPSLVACGGQFNLPLWISRTAFTCLTEIKGSEYQERLKGEGAFQLTDPLRASLLISAAEEEPMKGISLYLEPLSKQWHQPATQSPPPGLFPSLPFRIAESVVRCSYDFSETELLLLLRNPWLSQTLTHLIEVCLS